MQVGIRAGIMIKRNKELRMGRSMCVAQGRVGSGCLNLKSAVGVCTQPASYVSL